MQEPKISVIIPVYKVEDYITRAVESIRNQTFRNWEMILVDDGSPDNSGRICDALAVKDPRIRVIHQKNGGAPAARNAAIRISRGRYLYFMDGDDWAEPEMLAGMLDVAVTNNVQLVVCGFYIDTYYTDSEYTTTEVSAPDALYMNRQSFRENAYKYIDINLLNTPWNKLYEASYIKKNRLFYPDTHWDDWPFNMRVIRKISRVAISSGRYYHFQRARAESESEKYNRFLYKKRQQEYNWERKLYDYWGTYDDNAREMLSRRYVERLLGCIENLYNAESGLGFFGRMRRVSRMVHNPKVKEAFRYAKPRSVYMKLALVPVRVGIVPVIMLEGRIISYVKRNNTKLFANLKANR